MTIYTLFDDSRTICTWRVILWLWAREWAKNRERTLRLSAVAKNKTRLRNRACRAQQSDDLPLWKGWIWNSNDPNMGQHVLWCDSPHAERRAASLRREAAEAAFTLTKIDTLSDQLLSNQLRFTRRIICRAIWIGSRYRNVSPLVPPDIAWIFLAENCASSHRFSYDIDLRFLFKTVLMSTFLRFLYFRRIWGVKHILNYYYQY